MFLKRTPSTLTQEQIKAFKEATIRKLGKIPEDAIVWDTLTAKAKVLKFIKDNPRSKYEDIAKFVGDNCGKSRLGNIMREFTKQEIIKKEAVPAMFFYS